MSSIRLSTLRLLFCLAFVLQPILAVRPLYAQAATVTDRATDKQHHIEVVLTANLPARADQPIALTFTATPQLMAPDLHFDWSTPENSEFLGGAANEAVGAVPASKAVQQTRQLRLTGAGV